MNISKLNIGQWNKFERIWFTSFVLIILATTVIFSLSGTDYTDIQSVILNWLISPIGALTGIVSAILVAKGKISNYAWGFANAVIYAYISYLGGYYGDMIIYTFWNAPMRIIGFLFWKKQLRQNSKTDVKMKKMTWKQIVLTFTICAGGILSLGILLTHIDNWFVHVMQRNHSIYQYLENVFGVPYIGAMVDAATVIFQIVGVVLMTLAFTEQWLIWIVANILSIAMWVAVMIANPASIPWAMPTLIMWAAYLINSVYGYANWLKGSKTNL